MAKYSKTLCLDIKAITQNGKKSDFEKCEDIFQLLKAGFFGKELMDQYDTEYHVIHTVLTNFKITNAPWLTIRCLDRFVRYGRLHTMTDNLIKISLGIEHAGLSDAIKSAIRNVKINEYSTFVEKGTEMYNNAFDYTNGFYHDDNTAMLMICKKCEMQHLQTPKNHLKGRSPCFQCIMYAKGESIGDTNEPESVHWAKVLPNIFIGDIYSVTDAPFMITKRIKGVVDLTNAPLPFKVNSSVKTHKINVDDNPSANLQPYLNAAFEFINEFIAKGESVLVFCRAGVSRSASIVIYYIMRHYNITYNDSFRYVKTKRKQIQPNDGFIEQLLIEQAKI